MFKAEMVIIRQHVFLLAIENVCIVEYGNCNITSGQEVSKCN